MISIETTSTLMLLSTPTSTTSLTGCSYIDSLTND